MLDTILFDLDGTLLPLDMNRFIKHYFKEVGDYFQDMIEAEKLISHVWTGTEAMIGNKGVKTNKQVFMDTFENLIDGDLALYQERFDKFYDEGFLKLRYCTKVSPWMKQAVRILKNKGYTLAVATNPMFPKKAIFHRIKWAELNPEDFSYISSYEQNYFCKPNLEFYKEVLESLDKKPHQCMMVGNDVNDDMVASKLGIKTYLITNHLFNRFNLPVVSDHKGTYEEFYQFVEELPEIG